MASIARSRRAPLAVACGVLFVTFLDNTLISVVLAGIQSDLGAGVQTLQWVINGYALAFASLMLAGGMLGDLFGRKRVMLSGLTLFVVGSAIAAVAPGAGWLLMGRVVMGVGAAGSEPGTLSILRHIFEDRSERARAIGVWAAVSGTALAMGPVIAGVISGVFDWRAVLWFNLALGGAAFFAAWKVLPESCDPDRGGFDLQGALLGALALGTVIFATIQGESEGYATWWIVSLFVLSGLALVAFVRHELRVENPMLDLRLFRNGVFALSNTVAFTTFFGVFSIFFFVALYLQLLANQSPLGTALDFIPMTIVMIAASAITGRWVSRVGVRVPMFVGCILGGIGILLADAVIGPDVGFAGLSWTLAIAGAGFGIALVPVTSAALTTVAPEHSGMAAAATNTSRELGAVFGVAVLGTVVNGELTSSLIGRLQQLGIPANFQSIVIEAVKHGGVPKDASQAAKINPAARNAGPIVNEVLNAAEKAFQSGLHQALLISACMLLGSGVAVWFVMRGVHPTDDGTGTGLSHPQTDSGLSTPLRAIRFLIALIVVVGAAVSVEYFIGPTGLDTTTTTTTTTTTAKVADGKGPPTSTQLPTVSLSQATNLSNGQKVTVKGAGFDPDEPLVALECAVQGDKTSNGDCDLNHLQSVKTNSEGAVVLTMTVRRGPFGTNKRTCGPKQPCQIAVSAPRQNAGDQRATADISFAAP